MPIDPRIPLGIQSPQFADPLETFAKAQGVRNMLRQGPLQDAQLERLTLDNEQTRLENVALPAKAEAAKATADAAAKRAALDQKKVELDNLKTKTGLISNLAGSVKYAPEETRPAVYQSVRQQGIRDGLFKPEDVPEQYDPAFVDQQFRAAIDTDKQIDNHQKEIEFGQKVIEAAPKTAKEWNDLALNQASVATSQTELDHTRQMLKAAGVPKAVIDGLPDEWSKEAMEGLAKKAMTAEQRQAHAEKLFNDARTSAIKEYEYAKKTGAIPPTMTVEQYQDRDANRKRSVTNIYTPVAPPVGADGKPRQATLEDVPANIRSQVEGILNYDEKLPASGQRNPIQAAVRDWVTKVGPSVGYSESQYANRNKIASDFGASGVSGKAITSADTGLSHLHAVSEAGKALKSGDLTALNRLANFVGAQTGNSAPTVYDSIVETVAPEISKAVIGGVGGVEDRRQMAANFSRNLSEQAREGAVGATAKLLGTRFKKMADAYESDMGKPLKRKLSAESQAVLDRYSGSGGPAVGTVEQGYKFKGGDPADSKNWEKVK